MPWKKVLSSGSVISQKCSEIDEAIIADDAILHRSPDLGTANVQRTFQACLTKSENLFNFSGPIHVRA